MRALLRRLAECGPAWILLCGAAVVGLSSTAFIEADDVAHYEYSRWAPKHPEAILEVWGRPLVTLFYLVPAQFGPQAARMWSLLLGVAAALTAAALARRAGAKRPALAGVAALAMPYAFLQTYAIMTELLFSTLLAVAVLLWRDRRFVAAVAVVSFLPLARPEGFFLGVLFGFLCLLDGALTADFGRRLSFRRAALALGLATGTAVWWLAGLPLYGRVSWLLERWPKNWSAESPYGEGRPHPLLFTAFLALVVTPPLVPAFVVGATKAWRAARRLELGVVLFVVALHSVLWTFRMFGSAGYPRYLVTLTPLLGAVTGLGLERAVERLAARTRGGVAVDAATVGRRGRRYEYLCAGAALAAALAWPFARPWHGDLDVKTLHAAAAWFVRTYPDPASRPFVVVDHPAFRPAADVDADGASCRFEPLPLAFAPVGAVAVWETKFAARYSKATRADLARLGFEEVPRAEVAGPPPYPWDGPRPPFPDPELNDYDWGVFIRRRE
jgi:hypothetical protein